MWTQAVVVRGAVTLSLLAAGALAWGSAQESRRRAETATYYDGAFDRIEVGMSSPDVKRLLGSAGERVAPLGWPRTLGEVPGYSSGIPQGFAVAGSGASTSVGDGPPPPPDSPTQYRHVVSPRTEVWWRLWWVPGRHRWIAVAFLSDGSGGSLTVPTAIMKRSGATEQLPEVP
jgi:hypothetical protein